MKPKQIIVLIVILGILASGILLKSWIRSSSDNAGLARGGNVVFSEFDPGKPEKILIGRSSKTDVELAKDNGVWKVKSLWNAKADPVKVENLIEKLRSAQGELRGSGKNLFPDFGIQDSDAFSIQFFGAGNTPLSDLRLGTKQAGENGYFIRKSAGEDIYLVNINMAELLGISTPLNEAALQSFFWADRSLFDLDPEKVTKITLYLLKGEEKTMIMGLERKPDPRDPLKSSWKYLRKDMTSSLDPDKVLKFIAIMKSVQADKVVDPGGKDYGLEKPVWQLAVTQNSKKVFLSAGPKDEKADLFYVKRSGDPTIFGLQASFFTDLNVDDTHFVKDVPSVAKPPKDPAGDIPASLSEEPGQTA
jgi:hypothetical protein